MKIIEIETKLGKNGIIQIPEAELEATGLKEGDDICLSYLEPYVGKSADEFLIEKKGENHDVSK